MSEVNRRENMKRRDGGFGESRTSSRRRPSESAAERVVERIPINPQVATASQRKRPSGSAAERIAERIPLDPKPMAAQSGRKRPSATAAERIVEHIPAPERKPFASNPDPVPIKPIPPAAAKKSSGCCMLTMLSLIGVSAGIISLLAVIF